MSLQVEQDESFQRREWRAERVAWALGSLVLVAALLGLLGGTGPVSTATASSEAGDVSVEYLRFSHRQADNHLAVMIAATAVTDDRLEVAVSTSWLASADIRGISPEPIQQRTTGGDVVTWVFATEPGSDLRIDVSFRSVQLWRHDASITVDGETATFSQFVYP